MFLNNYHYSIKLYIAITMSIYCALSISVLFILLLQLVNGAQFLNITFSLVLVGAAAVPVLLSDIFPLRSMRRHNRITRP